MDNNIQDDNIQDDNIQDDNIQDDNIQDDNIQDDNIQGDNILGDNIQNDNIQESNNKDSNIRNDRPIQKHTFFNFNHYNYGEAFFGSYKGMRYRLARDPLANVIFIPPDQRGQAKLVATVWPEPYAYGQTDPSKMTSFEFEFSEDGFEKAVSWFNDQYEERIEQWSADYSILD